MTKYHYNWTVTSKYYYDQTLTTGLIKKHLDDLLDSSGKDTERYSLYNMADLSVWPSVREKQHDTSYHYEDEGDADPVPEPPANSTYHYYQNFTLATGINFADLRSSAAAANLWSHGYIPNGLGLADNTSAGNITFDKNGGITLSGGNTLANDITFIDGGEVLFTDAGSGTQRLTGLFASAFSFSGFFGLFSCLKKSRGSGQSPVFAAAIDGVILRNSFRFSVLLYNLRVSHNIYRPFQEQNSGIAEAESGTFDRTCSCPSKPLHSRLAELLFHCRCEVFHSANE